MMNFAAMDGKQVVQMSAYEMEQVQGKFTMDSYELEGEIALIKDVNCLQAILSANYINIHMLEEIVGAMTNGKGRMRDRRAMNVRVGSHNPPKGGEGVLIMTLQLLEELADGVDDPWAWKERFLWLHPFTDGNGRIARALWLRMEALKDANHIYQRLRRVGLMKAMYLAALESSNGRALQSFENCAALRPEDLSA